ncbi:MAG: stage III sporulation protein AD [Clostridia bacterium]|nr:stage III sporulation protein AD [Clostridia bacterium]
MDIFKIIGIGIIGTIIVGVLKGVRSDLAVYAIVVTGIVMLVNVISGLGGVVETFSSIIEKTKLDDGLFSGILKIVGIGYVTEYSAGLCSDAGGESIAQKILLSGKVAIFIISLPILNKLVETVVALIP